MSKTVKSPYTIPKIPSLSKSTSSIQVNPLRTKHSRPIPTPFHTPSRQINSPNHTPPRIQTSRKTLSLLHLNPLTSPSSPIQQTLTLPQTMASAVDSLNPQQQQPLQPDLQTQLQSSSSNLPQYSEMIMAAIEALNEKTGSSKAAISNQMESVHPDLPPAHTTLLSHHLNKMKQSGQLVMVKNNYMKPDPNAPPKRGRGRPPKPKAPLAPGTVLAPPRPRGRPPKPRDPFAPPAASQKKSSGGSGRPRGRPPKKAKTAPSSVPAAASSASAPATGAPRGRGRPPKVKPAVAPVAG